MTSSEQEAAADMTLARIKGGEPPAAIAASGEVKASKNGVLIVLTALAKLWNKLENSRSELARKEPSSLSDPSKVCQDAWKGRTCSSPSSCSRIHPPLCHDKDCKGKNACNLFHGRKRSRKSSLRSQPEHTGQRQDKPPQKSQKSQSKHQGNGKAGTRHPDKKTVPMKLPTFATSKGEEVCLCYRLAELEHQSSKSYRDVVASSPAPAQSRIALSSSPSPMKHLQLQGVKQPAVHASAIPALSIIIQRAITAALTKSGLLS